MTATPEERTISLATVGASNGGGTFDVKLNGDPRTLERAFVVYELEGLPHFTAALRSINGGRALGRFGVSRGAKGGVQVEEIDPALLQAGTNHVQFLPVDDHDPGSYRVRNLRIVGVPAGATRVSDASARAWQALRDGREGTGWSAAAKKPAQLREWTFSGATQPWALDLRIPERTTGTLIVSSADPRARSKGEVTVRLDDLTPGWHRLPLGHLPPTDKLTLELSAGKELGAAISELAVEGSALPTDAAPRVTVTYPLSGECVNHRVHVRGFVSPAEAEAIYANGARVDGALRGDGSFAMELGEREVAGRDLVVEATYGHGERAHQTVSIGRCVNRPPVVIAPDGRPRQPLDDLGAPFGVTVKAGHAATLDFDGVKLDIPEGAVEKDVRVTIRPLPSKDVAPLDPAMTNVSPSGQAFRFGPLGMMFKKAIKLSVPYDVKALPAGYSEKDVRTFYYDEAAHHWEQVALLGQDERRMIAVSNHFTDFVNATVPMPEHPGTQSENPTSLKDMRLADPTAGITQIEPPSGSSGGSARLSYGIEVPSGRHGVEPALSLSYDSDRTNTSGWVGVGWDLSLPSIEVDTRFGVPLYNGSEIYLLDGDPLVPITGRPGFYQRRVEGRFDQIQRLGSDPTSYSWVVTDKNGVKSTFGANANGANSTLADARSGHQPGNIFKWAVERVQDPTGNFMTVSYFPDSYTNGDTFTQIYPAKIQYTGNGSFAPPYEVDFTLDDGATRPDVVITGRPGFPVATRRRLTAISVSLSGTKIRSYTLQYETTAAQLANTFNKSVLASVAMIGADGVTQLYQHTFDYFTAPANDSLFAQPQPWGTLPSDQLTSAEDQLGGGSASVGIGISGVFSLTGSGGGDVGATSNKVGFFDGTGDGLPDQMNNNGTASVNQLLVSSSTAHFEPISFSGLSTVGHTSRSGWEAGGGISALSGLFGVSGSYSHHSAEDDEVVADMNGDGFPDLVRNSGGVNVQLNTGNETYTSAQSWNGFSLSGVVFNHQDRFTQANQAGAFFATEPLVRWVAPFAGTVNVSSTFQKVANGGDGVEVDTFVNNEGTPRQACALGPANLTPCIQTLPLTVNAGDRVYTKVNPLNDPASDEVTSAMTVAYTNVDPSVASQVEPYGAPIYTFDRNADFRLAGLPLVPWVASSDGTVQVQGCFSKLPSADDVKVSVVQKDTIQNGSGVLQQFTLSALSTDSGPLCIPQLQQPLAVKGGQSLSFQVTSDAQIDPNTVAWPASVSYTSYCRPDPTSGNSVCGAPVCNAGFCTIGPSDPLANFPVPAGLVQAQAEVNYQAFAWKPVTPGPTLSYVVPAAGSTSITWSVSTSTSPLVVLVQGVNKQLAKQAINAGSPTASIQISPTLGAGEQIFFTILSPSGVPVQPITVGAPIVNGTTLANVVNVLFPDPVLDNINAGVHDPMSNGYHRWWYGDWNGSDAFDETRIVVSNSPQKSDAFLFMTPSIGVATRPDLGAMPLWVGRGAGELITGGRIDAGFSASGAAAGNAAGVQSLREADTWNVDLQASAVGLSAGVNAGDSTTNIDLVDMNGDWYPDSVTSGGVQYNDGVGAFTSRMGVDMGLGDGGDLRSTTNASLRFGISIGDNTNQLINLAGTDSGTRKDVSTASISGSTDYGVSSTRIDLVDINGDGLPDHVSRKPGETGIHVRLNLGYSFGSEMVWPAPSWQRSEIPASILGFESSAITSALGAVGSIRRKLADWHRRPSLRRHPDQQPERRRSSRQHRRRRGWSQRQPNSHHRRLRRRQWRWAARSADARARRGSNNLPGQVEPGRPLRPRGDPLRSQLERQHRVAVDLPA